MDNPLHLVVPFRADRFLGAMIDLGQTNSEWWVSRQWRGISKARSAAGMNGYGHDKSTSYGTTESGSALVNIGVERYCEAQMAGMMSGLRRGREGGRGGVKAMLHLGMD